MPTRRWAWCLRSAVPWQPGRWSGRRQGLWTCGDRGTVAAKTSTSSHPSPWFRGPTASPWEASSTRGGWAGHASIDWPEHGLRLSASLLPSADFGDVQAEHCLVYRPPHGPAFCWEPITHPINAFHLPGRPGLRVLRQGEAMALAVVWSFTAI